ncbi:MAG: hypothetical protein LBT00_04435 [Spirochaetaceae bacterium]|nr:hypothetical protein [Spirochaetaceae bacterium]
MSGPPSGEGRHCEGGARSNPDEGGPYPGLPRYARNDGGSLAMTRAVGEGTSSLRGRSPKQSRRRMPSPWIAALRSQ